MYYFTGCDFIPKLLGDDVVVYDFTGNCSFCEVSIELMVYRGGQSVNNYRAIIQLCCWLNHLIFTCYNGIQLLQMITNHEFLLSVSNAQLFS